MLSFHGPITLLAIEGPSAKIIKCTSYSIGVKVINIIKTEFC